MLKEGVDILSHPAFDPANATLLYIHGYTETQANKSIDTIVRSYLQRGDHNIILLDWSQLSDGNYFMDAVPNSKQVSFKRFSISIFKKRIKTRSKLDIQSLDSAQFFQCFDQLNIQYSSSSWIKCIFLYTASSKSGKSFDWHVKQGAGYWEIPYSGTLAGRTT